MADNVTLATFRTEIRNRTDTRESYLSNARVDPLINASIADFQRLIINTNPDWLLSNQLISVVSGTMSYALPATFYLARGVDVLESSGEWSNMRPFNWGERNNFQNIGQGRLFTRYRIVGSNLRLMPSPGWTQTNGLNLWFIPTATSFDGSNASATVDVIQGGDEWITLNACIQVAAMQEEDPRVFASQLQMVERQIVSAVVHRDVGEPDRVRDVYKERSTRDYPDYWHP